MRFVVHAGRPTPTIRGGAAWPADSSAGATSARLFVERPPRPGSSTG